LTPTEAIEILDEVTDQLAEMLGNKFGVGLDTGQCEMLREAKARTTQVSRELREFDLVTEFDIPDDYEECLNDD
jgi:hypothetical protein